MKKLTLSRSADFLYELLAWLPFCLATLAVLALLPVILLVAAIVVPVFGLLQLVGFFFFSRSAVHVEVSEHGLHLSNKRGTIERFIPFADIDAIERTFKPPFFILEAVLHDEERVEMHYLDEEDRLAEELDRRGIGFDREPR